MRKNWLVLCWVVLMVVSIAVSCGDLGEPEIEPGGSALTLREALTLPQADLQELWVHGDRVRLYEQLAVYGSLQANVPDPAPVAAGEGLLGAPLDQLDGRRAALKQAPLLYPEVRSEGELAQASLPEELCWPAEYAFGQEHPVSPGFVLEGFSDEADAELLDRSAEQMAESLGPWLWAVAARSGWSELVVKAAPERPFLMALDHEGRVLHLNPAGLALIVAAASNQGQHLGRGGRDSVSAAAPPLVFGEAGADARTEDVEGALQSYEDYARSNPTALPMEYTEPEEGDTVCSCMNGRGEYGKSDSESISQCTCHAKGCACDMSKDLEELSEAQEDNDHDCACSRLKYETPSLADLARTLLVMCFPLLVFARWRSGTKD